MPPKIEIGPIVKVVKTDEEWKKLLTPEAYRVLRHEDTERPFINNMHDNKKAGVYYCAGCDLPLFSSEHKFDSGTGWPSFWQPIDPKVVRIHNRLQTDFPKDRSPLRPLRGASRTYLQGWPQADGVTVLHQWRRVEVRAGLA